MNATLTIGAADVPYLSGQPMYPNVRAKINGAIAV